MAEHGPSPGVGTDLNASFVDSSLLGVAISLPIIASTCVILRFFARRWRNSGKFRGDDWTVSFTLLFCWSHSANTIVAGGIGGINTITIPPREYPNLALRTLWISTFFLVTSLFTVKISILLFYWHLFSVNDRFKKACMTMIGILTLWWMSSIILVWCSTDPLDASWKDAARAKHRFNFNAWYLSYSGLSIFFDVVILCFPIPVIKTLSVNTRSKLSIIGIFWLGGFVCVSAVIRFVFLYNSIFRLQDLGTNQYSSITRAFVWAEIEPNTSVIAACLPTYGPLFREGGFIRKLSRSVRSTLATSNGAAQNQNPSPLPNSTAVGYYELDKVVSSNKGAGDIHTERVTAATETRLGHGGDRDIGHQPARLCSKD